jgi:hypothetical protein
MQVVNLSRKTEKTQDNKNSVKYLLIKTDTQINHGYSRT